MDTACSLPRSNVLYGGEVAGCRTLERLNLATSLKSNRICHNLFGLRLHSETISPKKLKKNYACCVSSASRRTLNESSLWQWCYSSSGSPLYNSRNLISISKRVGLSRCQGSESVAYLNGNGRDAEVIKTGEDKAGLKSIPSEFTGDEEGPQTPTLDELREALQKTLKDLEVARLSSTMYEEKAQTLSETAIALKDEATNAWEDVNRALGNIQDVIKEETIADEELQIAEARLNAAIDSLKIAEEKNGYPSASKESDPEDDIGKEDSSEDEVLLASREDVKKCQDHLEKCEAELRRLQSRKEELQKEVDRLNVAAEQAQIKASIAEEDVANIMLLAEQAVANELEAAQRADDADVALQKAEKNLALPSIDNVDFAVEGITGLEVSQGSTADGAVEVAELLGQPEESSLSNERDNENGKLTVDVVKDSEADKEKLKSIQSKVHEMQKESTKESSPLSAPKALLKKSSRFFSASFFSSTADEEEFTPVSVFHGLMESAKKQLPKLVFGSLLVGAGFVFYVNRGDRVKQLFQQPDIITTGIDEVSTTAKPLVREIRKLPAKLKKLMERSLFSFALSISLLLHTLCLGQPILNSNTDKQALISFKKYITSDPYGVGPSWSEDTPFCNWTGVSCSVKHHRVIGLGLSHLDLAGTVAPHLGNLTFLRQFDIGFNNFTGSLPELAKLRRLEVINIGSNSFTGEIPTWLGSLPRLKFVYFGSNKLSGLISSDICNNMLELSLFDNQLEGKIPTNISKCRHLDLLDLSENNLVGSIPREIGNMTMLESLSLGHNDLTGGIPSEIGNLRSLHTLDLANNQLTGFIPNIMGEMSQLATLALSSNRLIGEIPSSICNLTSSFEFLYLSNNRLDGSIPQCLEKFSRSLQVLDLGENHFDGLIPSNFTKGCSLMLLNLNMNRLEGVLPQSLVKCRRLLVLDIGNNRLEGTFPFWIQNLAYLGVLILRSNNFSGTISHTMNPSVNLQVFDISHNAFTGSVPTGYWKFFKAMKVAHEHLTSKQEWYEFFKDPFSITLKGNDASFTRILKSFTTIDLSSNRFSGTISDSIGDLISLMHLNLSHNCFTGHIPASLGNVSTLESLDLSSNQLAGKIPTQLTKLTFLSKLNLSMNNLSGQIPQFTGQFLTFENASYVGNSGLCGFPLTQKCEGSSPPEVMITEEGGGSEFLEGFCWEAVVSGYGSGFVLGVTIGYLILAYGKPKWFVDWLYGIYRIKRRRGRGNVAQRRRPSRAN